MAALRLQPVAQNRPIREIAYEVLKRAIIAGEIPAGERIVETEYAQRLHISRTPLREALRKLERDGLVEYVMRRGVVVRAFTVADVEEIYTIRNALEMLMLPSIIENVTDADVRALRGHLSLMDEAMALGSVEKLSPLARAFHSQVMKISGRIRILRVIEGQDEYINRFSAMSIAKDERRQEAHREHYEIVDCLARRDLPGLKAVMDGHIEHSKANCLAAMKEEQEGARPRKN